MCSVYIKCKMDLPYEWVLLLQSKWESLNIIFYLYGPLFFHMNYQQDIFVRLKPYNYRHWTQNKLNLKSKSLLVLGSKLACIVSSDFIVQNCPQFRHKTHNFMQCVQVTSILPLMSHLFLWWPTTKRPGHWRKDVRLFLFFTCQVTKEQVMSAENLWNMFSLIIQDYGLILGELINWVSS